MTFNLEDTVSDPPTHPPLHFGTSHGHPNTQRRSLGGEQSPAFPLGQPLLGEIAQLPALADVSTLSVRRADPAARVPSPAVHPPSHHDAPPNQSSNTGLTGISYLHVGIAPPFKLTHHNTGLWTPFHKTVQTQLLKAILVLQDPDRAGILGARRPRRSSFAPPLNSCSRVEGEDQQHCCVDSVIVDFAELGWHFLLSPPTLEFTYCRQLSFRQNG